MSRWFRYEARGSPSLGIKLNVTSGQACCTKPCLFICHNQVITRVIISRATRLPRGGFMGVLKVTTVGNSVGVILPKEILERLRVKRGDSLYVVETKNGIQLTAYDPAFAQQVAI